MAEEEYSFERDVEHLMDCPDGRCSRLSQYPRQPFLYSFDIPCDSWWLLLIQYFGNTKGYKAGLIGWFGENEEKQKQVYTDSKARGSSILYICANRKEGT